MSNHMSCFSSFTCEKIFVVQLLNRVWLFETLWTAAHWVLLSFTISQSLLRLRSIESVIPSNHLILYPPPSPALNLSQHHGLFQWVGSSHQVAQVLELQFQSFQGIFSVDFLVWSPCCPSNSQEESSPAPQFKSINSSAKREAWLH